MNAITAATTKGEEEPTLEVMRLTSRISNALEAMGGRYSISSRSALTESERAALTRRADELRIGLTPAEAAEIGAEVLRLMAGYPSLRLTHEEAARTAATFVAALSGLPLWAIRKACMRWATGRVQGSNPAFPPSAPELRIAADAVARPRQHEAGSIKTALCAEVERVPTDEERAKAIARYEETIRPAMIRATAPTAPAAPAHVTPSRTTDPGGAEAQRVERERAEQEEANTRTLAREHAAHGITDGRPLTVDMRRKLGMTAKPTRRRAKREKVDDER